MNRPVKFIALALLMAMLLGGCAMRTVEDMYRVPRRSEDYNNLQSAIDSAMTGLEYAAPVSGENQQTVQMADLDGDGMQEYLLFARGKSEKPMHILIFRRNGQSYQLMERIETYLSEYDRHGTDHISVDLDE